MKETIRYLISSSLLLINKLKKVVGKQYSLKINLAKRDKIQGGKYDIIYGRNK